MVNGGKPNWQTGQQVMHRSQEHHDTPTCLIVVASGEHPETKEVMYNCQWISVSGELFLASIPQLALTHWRSKH